VNAFLDQIAQHSQQPVTLASGRGSCLRVLWKTALVLTLLVSSAGESPGQSKYPVRMRLEPLTIRGRSGGPLPLQFKLEYNSSQILEGDLYLEIYNTVQASSDLAATVRFEGIVLQGNDYFFQAILPPIEHSFGKQYLIVSWFETETGRIPLSLDPKNPEEPTELLSIGPGQRATLICSCSGRSDSQRLSANRRFLNRALSLNNYNPLAKDEEDDQESNVSMDQESQHVLNYAASWDAIDLPEDPLTLCSFDVVLLADGALSRLDPAQLKALRTWCEAGGSICVLPDDTNLKGQHLQFLQTLFERGADSELALSLTDDGSALRIGTSEDAIIHRHVGFGRATLLPNTDDIGARFDGREEELGALVAHLWKVRKDSGIQKGDRWRLGATKQMLQDRGLVVKERNGRYFEQRDNQRPFKDLDEMAEFYGIGYELPPQRRPITSAAETALMPQDVKMVPSWIIGLLLIAYVITIGPVDYFVLGAFRIRKYTWVLFPVVTAAFTALTILIAHHYMASTETGGRLTIVDVVEDGRAVRLSSLQMYFYGQQTERNEDMKSEFVIPAQMILGGSNPGSGRRNPGPISASMHYHGRFPQSYATTLNLRQWEPQMTRSLSLSPDQSIVPDIPWNDFTLIDSHKGRQRLRTILSRLNQSGTQVDAVVLNGKQRLPIFPNNGFMFSSAAISAGQNWLNVEPWQQQHQVPAVNGLLSVGILDASVRTGTHDYFNVVSQVSPHGAASMEDLPVMDSSDHNQWLLIVAIKQDLQTHIVRKLFFQDEERSRAEAEQQQQ